MTGQKKIFQNISNQNPLLRNSAYYINFPNRDVIFALIPEEMRVFLLAEAYEEREKWHQTNTMKDRLVGHIREEFSLEHCIPKVKDFILRHAEQYDKNYQLSSMQTATKGPLVLKSLWVNFQKKHEFNPPHTHNGLISFVIWMKIPYELSEEVEFFPDAKSKEASKFNFVVSSVTGSLSTLAIPVDKNYEGMICFFPSSMMHYVNPFYTSDDYRISISGNIEIGAE